MDSQMPPVQPPVPPKSTNHLQLLRLSGSGAFALVIIMFFFTFCFVKCNETKLIRFTGIDLAFALEGKPSKEMNSFSKMGKDKNMFDMGNESSSPDNAFEQAVNSSSRRSDSKGLKQQGYKIYNAMALLALLLSAGAMVVSIFPAHKYGIIAFLMGLAVVMSLLLVQVFFNMELTKSGNASGSGSLGMSMKVGTEYTFFYWFSILLAIAGAVTGLIRFLQNKKNPKDLPVAAF